MSSSGSSWDVVSSSVFSEMEKIQACVEGVSHIHHQVNSYVGYVAEDYEPFAIVKHSFKELLSVFDPEIQREAGKRQNLVVQHFTGVRKAEEVLNHGLYVLRMNSKRIEQLSEIVSSSNSSETSSDVSDLSNASLNSLTEAQGKINQEISGIEKTLKNVESLITRIFASQNEH